MSNKLIPRIYKCKCGTAMTEHVWDSDLRKKKFKCPDCSLPLGFENLRVEKVGIATAIRTPTKNR